MYAREALKRTFERLTGVARSSPRDAASRVTPRKAWLFRFEDDGTVPNNPVLPFVRYRGAVDLTDAADPAAVFEQLFEANGWGGSWRNGIYDYVHYHPRTHEVLGIASGEARVRFGGAKGRVVRLKAGDVAILPAGTGHEALSATRDLVVVGAYPPDGQYEEYEGSTKEHDRAVEMIPKVPRPRKDPVYGAGGPLLKAWRKRRSARTSK